MAKVGKLNVQITAGTKGLDTGLARASRKLGAFSRMAGRGLGGLTGLGAQLTRDGLAAGVTAIGASVGVAAVSFKKGAAQIDDLAKSSKKLLGIGSTGALAGMRLAAEENGVAVEQLDKGVGKMLDTIAAAGRGEQSSIAPLEALGLTAERLKRLRPEERLGAIADKLRLVGDAGDRINLARDIFGRSGEDLMVLLMAGSGAIRTATREMQLYGHALSAVDATTVEEANDTLGKIKKIGEGLAMQFAKQVAPLVTEVGMRLVNMVQDANGLGGAVANAFEQGVNFAGNFLDAVEDLQISWLNLKKTVFQVSADMANKLWGGEGEGSTSAFAAEKELERRAAMVPEHRREEFIKRARAEGGFQDERVHFGRIGQGFQEQADEADSAIAGIQQRRNEKGTLGERFKDFVHDAQSSALERAQNSLLDQEKSITGELEAQTEEREKHANQAAGQGRAALTAFGGPTFAFEAAMASTAADRAGAKEKADGDDETHNLLREINSTLRGGVAATYS